MSRGEREREKEREREREREGGWSYTDIISSGPVKINVAGKRVDSPSRCISWMLPLLPLSPILLIYLILLLLTPLSLSVFHLHQVLKGTAFATSEGEREKERERKRERANFASRKNCGMENKCRFD